MTDTARLPRAVLIERRLKVLEVEAAMQRMTLAATFSQWHQPRALTWAVEAAKFAGGMLKTPTARWVLTALLMRLIRGRG
jgi:hypothetical protein